MTGKRGGEEGERGGVGEEEVVGLAARQKSFLHGAAPEIFGQAIQLVHEKIDKIVNFGSNLSSSPNKIWAPIDIRKYTLKKDTFEN